MNKITRRSVAGLLAAAPLAISLPQVAISKSAAKPSAIAPTMRLKVGRFEVTFLSDGFVDLPYEVFSGAPPEQVKQAAAGHFAAGPTGIRAGFTVWLIRDGDRYILVDVGPAGADIAKNSGRLPQALAAIGITPDAIDAVIITHMHFDHISGLVAGDKKVYRNAEVYIDRRDVKFFTEGANVSKNPAILKSSFEKSQLVAKLYPKLQAVDGERQIVSGISTFDLSGHTPGHTGVRIEDSGESLLLVADMLLHPAAHPALPGIGILFEHDKAAADASRARFFQIAAERKTLLAATHMPFPGLGRIVKDGATLKWMAADWNYEGN